MCGILGTTDKDGDILGALNKIQYRGPNGTRWESLLDCNMGFVRLAIRDLSENAMQPMSNLNKDVWITYNGEIYGETALKESLIKKGYQFQTTSDTEVILNAYLEYGDKFVDHIDGMFAIAIYDMRVKKIFLYRDRVGIKPLFYYYDGQTFTYASEMKAILEFHKNITFKRDNSAIYDYFTYRYIPEPKTLYEKIYKLEPACKLTFDCFERSLKKEKYWKLKVNTKLGACKDKKIIYEKTRALIRKSVKEQLVSDVPVGTFLSGGIDSSIVSAEIYSMTRNVHAFSMGFEIRNAKERNYDETLYAKQLADLYQFPITFGKFDSIQLGKLRRNIREWFDEPFADTSCYPTYMISKMARENNVPVILTGDGGDEVFGGYTRYTVFDKKVKDKKSWTLLCDLYTKVLKNVLPSEEWNEEFLDAVSLFAREAYAYSRTDKSEYIQKLGIGLDYDDFWYFRKYDHEELPPITRAQYIDFKTYLPADILTKVDRVSMQNSIETRVPLLSKKIVEYAFSLSQEERCENGELKGLLKKTYADIIPRSILYKEKKGFSFPGSYWKVGESDRWIIWNENFGKYTRN